MKIKIDYNNMLDTMLDEQGFAIADIEAIMPIAMKAFSDVQSNRGKGWEGWMELMYNQTDIVKDIIKTADDIKCKFKNFVVLGIGGSALGPIAVFQAMKHIYYNELPDDKRGGPRFYVLDNVDPEKISALLDIIDIKETMFNVITKSGATSETMSQYLIIENLLKEKLGDKANEHIIATTDACKGNLIKLVKKEGYKHYVIADSVGGRFSELCPVGLLPAAVVGIDIEMLLKGAAEMDEMCKNADAYKNPALMTALLQYMAMNTGKNISVMMPYAESLKLIADWYCQIWGESLGKMVDNEGNFVYSGQTPVKALGVTDQHSQVQLYTQGPFDKVVTFIEVEQFRKDIVIPNGCEDFPDVNFLCGNALSTLLNTELKATRYALTKAQRMNYTIILPQVNEFTLGQLLYLFEMQTAFTGAMLNINTYNQPGVEEGKNATYALFGRKGYEKKKIELENAPQSDENYII
ncbi:MAG: glucose-6-phosphate isomerase [Clostridia bacterium]